MNKKIYAVMSSAALASVLTAAISTTVFAEVDGFVVENNGKKLVYNYDELMASSVDAFMGDKAPLYEEYLTGKLIAFHDDKVGYVKEQAVMDASTDAFMDNKEFVLDKFTEAAKESDIDTSIKAENVTERTVNKDGKVVDKEVTKPEVETLKVESVSAITNTEVTVKLTDAVKEVKAEQFQVLANGNKIVPTKVELADVSENIYKLTIPELKDQGELTVNGTKAVKYDFKAPEFKSIKAVANNRVMITFDEEVSVINKSNFEIKSVVKTEQADAITVESAVVQADKTKVLLTLNKSMTSGKSNYVFNMGKNAIKDIYTDIANPNEAYQVVFDGIGTKDTKGATLVSAKYEKATKKISVQFNKEMSAQFDTTKVSINGINLTAQDGVAQDAQNKNIFAITLSDATKAKVDALVGDLTVKLAKDTVADKSDATLKNVETTATLKVVIAPEFVDADSDYDENTHILTLKFSAPVKVKNIANIKVAGDNALNQTTVASDNKDDVINKEIASETIKIKLGDTNQAHVQGLAKDSKLQVKLAIGAVEDVNKVENSVAYDKQIKFVIDEVKPVLKTVAYANSDKTLTLEFSEPVRKSVIDENKIGFIINGADEQLNKVTTSAKVKDNRLIVTLDEEDATKLQHAYNENQSIKMVLKSDAVQDCAGTSNLLENNLNDEIKKENAVKVLFINTTVPEWNPTVLSSTQIKLEFTGKMDKALIENKANYILKDLYGKNIVVKSIVQDSGNQLVAYITTEKPMTIKNVGHNAYTLSIENLKSIEGIVVPWEEKSFDGKDSKADAIAPVITKAEYKVVTGYNNDTIEVEFEEASGLDKASAINPNNYVLIDGTKQIQLTDENAKVELGKLAVNKQTATITLKGINLDGKERRKAGSYKIKVSNVKDVLGNVIVTKNKANIKDLTRNQASDGTFNEENITGLATANPNTADKIVLTFAEELDKVTAEKAENYTVAIGKGVNPVTAVLDETGKKVTLTLTESSKISGQDIKVKLNGIQDASKNTITANKEVTATVADLVKPAFAKKDAIKAEAKKSIAQDEITLKFTEAIQKTLAEDETNYVVKVNGKELVGKVNAVDDGDYIAESTGDTVTIKLIDAKANFVKGDIITVTAKGIKDNAGNIMDEATVTVTATTTAPVTDTGAKAVFEVGSNRKVEVTFNDKLLASTVSKEDFVVEGNVVNDVVVNSADTTKVTLTLAAPVAAGNDVIIKASKVFAIKDEVGNDLTVKSLGADTGVKSNKVVAAKSDVKVLTVKSGSEAVATVTEGTKVVEVANNTTTVANLIKALEVDGGKGSVKVYTDNKKTAEAQGSDNATATMVVEAIAENTTAKQVYTISIK